MKTTIVSADRIVGAAWSVEQLRAMAECYEVIQSHTLYSSTAVRLASRTGLIDRSSVSSMVTATMGGIGGTYWMVAALTTAQLALSFPHLLTEEQISLLLTPLTVAESLTGTGMVTARTA